VIALAFGRRTRVLLLGVLLLPACEKPAPVEPAAPPVVVEPQLEPPPLKPRKPARGGVGGGAVDAVGGLLVGSAPAPAEAQALKEKYQALLVGTWTADLGDGYRQELTYNAEGTYSSLLSGPMPTTANGGYVVSQAVGTRAVKLTLNDGARTITVSFDGDAIEQPSLRPGVTGTFRKKK